MLSGSQDLYSFIREATTAGERKAVPASAVPRVGLKGFNFSDGPRGITAGRGTCFPVAMARAATFSPELEERVGETMGREARALGVDLVAAPCINVLRHPAWAGPRRPTARTPSSWARWARPSSAVCSGTLWPV